METLAVALLLLGASAYAVDLSTHHVYEQKTERFNFTYVCSLTGYKVEGMTWSVCRKGETKLLGCVMESGEKLEFGQLYTDSHAQYRCERDGDKVRLRPVACVLDGKILELHRGAFSGSFYYKCSTRADGGIGLDITGCKDERLNIAVPFKSTFRRGDFQFMCDTDGEKAFSVGTGCYVDRKLRKLGERYRLDDFYYECRRKGKRGIKTEAIGCVGESKQFVDIEDTFRDGFVLYQCVDSETEGVTTEPVGCVIKDQKTEQLVEYRFGETFYESYKKGLLYKMQCSKDGDEIGPQIVKCIATSDSGERMELDIGCGDLFEGKAFICKDMGEGRVMAELKSLKPEKRTLEDVMKEHSVKKCDVAHD